MLNVGHSSSYEYSKCGGNSHGVQIMLLWQEVIVNLLDENSSLSYFDRNGIIIKSYKL